MNQVDVNANEVLYIGADVHERETQLAIYEPGGRLLQEKRIPTKDLQSYVHSLPAKEKHLALESVGFIYPLYDKLRQVPGCEVAPRTSSANTSIKSLVRALFHARLVNLRLRVCEVGPSVYHYSKDGQSNHIPRHRYDAQGTHR